MSKKQIWLRPDQVTTLETCLLFVSNAHKRQLSGPVRGIDDLAHTIALASVNELLAALPKINAAKHIEGARP